MITPGHAHALLTAAYVLSRGALAWAGLRFSFSLDWMWLSDPGDLRNNLLQTLLYYHAFPPGMNALTGVLLKLAGPAAPLLAHAVFLVFGLVFANALFYVGCALGLSVRAAFVTTLAFCLTPPALYFEHLYLYEWPIATLLCVSAVLFYSASRRSSSTLRWLAFFAVCSLIGYTRSTFHLGWLLALSALAFALTTPRHRRFVLSGAAIPAILLCSLYAKNAVMFGDFAASTFGPASYALVTMGGLPAEARSQLMRDGLLSPFAGISVYSPPRTYAGFFQTAAHPEWPPQMTRLEHRDVAAPNFNHWWLLEVHQARRRDALYTVQQRPGNYLRNAGVNLRETFGPSTAWHPRDGTPASPHHQHRQVLGAYEAWFNIAVHRFPVSPVGLYVVLPPMLLWAFSHAWSLWRRDDADLRARGALLFFCLFQITYVVAASSLLTALESARYRFQIEWAIWIVAAACLTRLPQLFRHQRRSHQRYGR